MGSIIVARHLPFWGTGRAFGGSGNHRFVRDRPHHRDCRSTVSRVPRPHLSASVRSLHDRAKWLTSDTPLLVRLVHRNGCWLLGVPLVGWCAATGWLVLSRPHRRSRFRFRLTQETDLESHVASSSLPPSSPPPLQGSTQPPLPWHQSQRR